MPEALRDDFSEWDSSGLPSGEELPCEDGVPLETQRHRHAMNLLIDIIEDHWSDRDDFYAGGNMFFYFSPQQVKRNDFRGPDVMVCMGVSRHERKSWVLWEEDWKVPNLVIELTSPSTARFDRGPKKGVYWGLGVETYVLYDPFSTDLEVYQYGESGYVPAVADPHGHFPVPALDLSLGVWDGEHLRYPTWLRWYDADGDLIPTPRERAEAAKSEAEAAKSEAEAAKSEAEAAKAANEALTARLAALEARLGGRDD